MKSIQTLFTAVCVALVLAASFAFVKQAYAQPITMPDTRAGELMSLFIDAFNSGSEDAWREFITQNWKKAPDSTIFERRVGFFHQLYGDLGGIDAVRIDESSDSTIAVLMKARDPHGMFEWLVLGLRVTPGPEQLVDGMSAKPGEDPEDALPEGEMDDKQMAAYLDEYIDQLAAEERFSGAVLVAREGIPIYTKACGDATKRWNIPNKLDTKFNLGSMNKMFTGVAIAQLAEQGKLSFTDTIVKHLPDYPNKQVAENVTIHQLLTHTSGIGDYWEELFDSHWWEIKTVQQLADLTANKDLEFEPGERFGYSNAGPVVLGLIIEAVSGMDYYDYIRENIYKPAGMINSDCYDVDRPIPNLAIGYTKSDVNGQRTDEWHNNLFMHASKGGPAGGGYSTVEDLLAFDKALRNNTLLSKPYFDTLTTGKVEMGPDFMYAYLFGDRTDRGHRIIGHNGGAPGISAALDMYMDLGYTVAVMSNYDMAAETISHKIGEILLR